MNRIILTSTILAVLAIASFTVLAVNGSTNQPCPKPTVAEPSGNYQPQTSVVAAIKSFCSAHVTYYIINTGTNSTVLKGSLNVVANNATIIYHTALSTGSYDSVIIVSISGSPLGGYVSPFKMG